MIYFCDRCVTFLAATIVLENSASPICPQCKEYVRACYWYFAGLRRFPNLVKERIDVDSLFRLCATCKSRFSCWTE